MSKLIRTMAVPVVLATVGLAAIDAACADTAQTAARMTSAAQAFLGALDETQRKASRFPFEGDRRARWSNLPVIMMQPNGLLIGDLNDEQRAALHELLRASLSSQGYAKVSGIMRLDDLLHELAGRGLDESPAGDDNLFMRGLVSSYSSGNYAVAVFGEPGAGDWGWQLDGHHVGANFTVSADRVAFTPTFLGSNPMRVPDGRYAGWMALPHEGARGIDLMRSLTAEQQAAATITQEVPADIFEGPGRRASLARFEGLEAGELSVMQMRLLRALVSEYVRNADPYAADAQLELIERTGWEELWFSWRGPVDPDGRFYYRVHGPRLLIEYNRQDPNHDHSIVRDPQNDYGEDWLEQHYTEHHPSLEEAVDTATRRAEEMFK